MRRRGAVLRYVTRSPLSSAAREGPTKPDSGGGEEETQAEAARAEPQLLLHGREVPGVLQDHHCLQPRPDCRVVCQLFHRPLSAHGRESETH